MIPLDIPSLQKHLQSLGFVNHFQAETSQIIIDLPVWDNALPVFLRLYDDGDMLQLVILLPVQLKPETLHDVGRLLHILNKEIDIPGFCLEEDMRIAFYRLSVPVFDDGIHPLYLKTMLLSIQNLVQQCTPVIAQAALGRLDIDKAIEQVRSGNQSPSYATLSQEDL